MAGKKIRCKSCEAIIAVKAADEPDDAEEDSSPVPPREKSAKKGSDADSARSRRPVKNDDDDEDDRPVRKKKRRRKKVNENAQKMWLMIGGAIALVVVVGIVIFFATRGDSTKNVVPSQAEGPKVNPNVLPPNDPKAGKGKPIELAQHGTIAREYAVVVNALADTFSQVRDAASVEIATSTMQEQTKKLQEITTRMDGQRFGIQGTFPTLT